MRYESKAEVNRLEMRTTQRLAKRSIVEKSPSCTSTFLILWHGPCKPTKAGLPSWFSCRGFVHFVVNKDYSLFYYFIKVQIVRRPMLKSLQRSLGRS
jgi:hypothetical protein